MNFRISCSNFDAHLKSQNFKTHFSGCVCIERRAILQSSESLNPKEPGIKKIRYTDLKGDLTFFASRFGLCTFLKKIPPGVSALIYQHQKDNALI